MVKSLSNCLIFQNPKVCEMSVFTIAITFSGFNYAILISGADYIPILLKHLLKIEEWTLINQLWCITFYNNLQQ